ncbi:hypothetical protein EYF80_005893 [Liparis tanakae]|uniref:Kazrin n=1 Tax=Liparis tanakae TaxID=230148 RepID=A0A4Z2J3K9_9TELE|nr:hypothetical protein EYF80_005893 [Liparis tanakae]
MEDTLTCSHATFSQVFGRQGQLMHARFAADTKISRANTSLSSNVKHILMSCPPRSHQQHGATCVWEGPPCARKHASFCIPPQFRRNAEAVQSLNSLNDQIAQFMVTRPCSLTHEDKAFIPGERDTLRKSMTLMRHLLVDAQSSKMEFLGFLTSLRRQTDNMAENHLLTLFRMLKVAYSRGAHVSMETMSTVTKRIRISTRISLPSKESCRQAIILILIKSSGTALHPQPCGPLSPSGGTVRLFVITRLSEMGEGHGCKGKILKMMEDNKHLAQRIDGAIQSASQEVTNLRSELSATSRRLAELGASSPPALENHHQYNHHDDSLHYRGECHSMCMDVNE